MDPEVFYAMCYQHASCDEFLRASEKRNYVAKREKEFYFVREHEGKLFICRCDVNGNNGKVLAEAYEPTGRNEYVMFESCYIAVNVRGIMFAYVRCYEGAPKSFKPELIVKHFSINGDMLAEWKTPVASVFDGEYHHIEIGSFYVYDDCFYYVEKQKKIKKIDMGLMNERAVYSSNKSIAEICVNKNIITFSEDVIKTDSSGYCEEWKVLDSQTNQVDSLWNQRTKPIRFINSALGIAWVEVGESESKPICIYDIEKERERYETEYIKLEAIYYWGDKKGKIANDVAWDNYFWLLKSELEKLRSDGSRIYFDGFNYYRSTDYNIFAEVVVNRCSYYNWSSNNLGHGRCDKFFVKGDTLFLDIDANGTKIYKIPTGAIIHKDGTYNGKEWPLWFPSDEDYVQKDSVYEDASFDASFNYAKVFSEGSNNIVMGESLYDDVKVGKLVQTTFRDLIMYDVNPFEIMNLQDLKYSKETFGLSFPVLVSAESNYDKARYYSKPVTINGRQYMLCSQWYEKNKAPLVQWISKYKI